MKAKAREKQIITVFRAIQKGSATSTEVSALTGLSVKHCSAHLSELELAGMIRRTRRRIRYSGSKDSIVWEMPESQGRLFEEPPRKAEQGALL